MGEKQSKHFFVAFGRKKPSACIWYCISPLFFPCCCCVLVNLFHPAGGLCLDFSNWPNYQPLPSDKIYKNTKYLIQNTKYKNKSIFLRHRINGSKLSGLCLDIGNWPKTSHGQNIKWIDTKFSLEFSNWPNYEPLPLLNQHQVLLTMTEPFFPSFQISPFSPNLLL